MCFYIESQNATDNKNCITEYSHRKIRMKFSTCKINPLVHQPNISNLMREQAPSEGCMPYILALSTEARLHPGFHSLVRPIGLTGHPPRMAMHDRLLGPSKQKAESLSQFYLHGITIDTKIYPVSFARCSTAWSSYASHSRHYHRKAVQSTRLRDGLEDVVETHPTPWRRRGFCDYCYKERSLVRLLSSKRFYRRAYFLRNKDCTSTTERLPAWLIFTAPGSEWFATETCRARPRSGIRLRVMSQNTLSKTP